MTLSIQLNTFYMYTCACVPHTHTHTNTHTDVTCTPSRTPQWMCGQACLDKSRPYFPMPRGMKKLPVSHYFIRWFSILYVDILMETHWISFSNKYIYARGPGVAYWLRRCTTSQTVLGSIPGGVTGFFSDIFLLTVPRPWGRLSP